MVRGGFNNLSWGFLFIMIDFRIQGFDIFADVIGYILFGIGFSKLAMCSTYFKKAAPINAIMIIVSIFSIHEKTIQVEGTYVNAFEFIVGVISLVLGLMVVYYLFMGIKDLAENQGKTDLFEEAGKRWIQFLILQLAAFGILVLMVVPAVVLLFIIALFIATLVLTFAIMGFMRRCGENLS